ncbi:MAG: TonB-dependent receptor [Bryobacteraceae bacterium]|nr:carboxypeptidase regulatory-like domain-containing protein [Bryobacterales bacterium]NUN03134.1 TonB-dependent receptor [Bryobacteraceae bacterium]
MKHARFCVVLGVLMVAADGSVLAQSSEFTGQVTDITGAVIAGANITARHLSTGVSRSTITNEGGYYTIRLLNSGPYELIAQSAGFKSITRSGITLEIAQTARVDFRLEVGEVREQVVVNDSAPILQTESASVSQLISQQSVLDLPLNGRNFTALATLVPGTVGGGGSSWVDSYGVVVNGMRASSTSFVIDGVSATNQTFSGTSLTPPPDAIQEFKVHTNSLSAEHGQGGAVINVQLKSGTNELHGGFYDFVRNEKLDARNFFARRNAPLRQNQFGGQLGGPLIRNRSFLFGDYEGTVVRTGSTRNAVVPSPAIRSGDFSGLTTIKDPLSGTPFPGNRIPANRTSPQALYFLDFIPQPNSPTGTYIDNARATSDTHQFDVRFDHHFSEMAQVNATYSFQQRNRVSPGGLPENGGTTADLRFQRIGIGEIHTFNPSTMNEFRVGYLRSVSTQTQQGLGTDHAAKAGIGGLQQTAAEFPGFPGLGISGYTGFNANFWVPIRFREVMFELRDNISWVRNTHTIRAGFYYRHMREDSFNAGYSRGNLSFTGVYSGESFADYLLGYPYSGNRSFPRNLSGIIQHNENAYIQDDWKVTPRLTLNLGLRYELNHPATGLHNQAASLDFLRRRILVSSDDQGNINLTSQQVSKFAYPMFADVIVPSSKAGLPRTLRLVDANNFAPRVGAAVQLPHNFVLRSGYGFLYALEQGNQMVSTQMINIPFIADELSNFNTRPVPTKDMTNFFQPFSTSGFGLGPVFFFDLDPNRRDLYLQQWNFAVQTSIGGAVSLEAAYVGSKGTKLSFSVPRNVPDPGPGSIQARREWSRFGEGVYLSSMGNSTYNSLQMKAEVRNRRGFSMLASYTFGKSISDQSGDNQNSSVQDPRNPRAEKGRDSWDRRHIFIFSSTYALPFFGNTSGLVRHVLGGWNVSNVVAMWTGAPFTPGISVDTANTGRSMRPDRIADGRLAQPTIERWFDPAAFRIPGQYTYGNSGRNILEGPSTRRWDFGVLKNFPIHLLGEGSTLQFRAEFFNFLNTPPFGTPTANIQSSRVGQILSAGAPRQIQFALKVMF